MGLKSQFLPIYEFSIVMRSDGGFMGKNLRGKIVGLFVEEGFEQGELEKTKKALEEAGAIIELVSPTKKKNLKAWKNKNWGDDFEVDVSLEEARSEDYDALIIPGGVLSVDSLRKNPSSAEFVKEFLMAGKPVGAISHGQSLLIDTEVLEGRTVTSHPSIQFDLINAHAKWVDEGVVSDKGVVTCRGVYDLHSFHQKMIEEIFQGIQKKQAELAQDQVRSHSIM